MTDVMNANIHVIKIANIANMDNVRNVKDNFIYSKIDVMKQNNYNNKFIVHTNANYASMIFAWNVMKIIF